MKQIPWFGAIAGVVVAVAGANIVDQPLKAIFLISVLVLAHEFLGDRP